MDKSTTSGNITLIIGPMFAGKCFSPNTKLLMSDGTSKTVHEIQINDELLSLNSVGRVINKFYGIGELFSIKYNNKELIVNKFHILPLLHKENTKLDDILNIEVNDYINNYELYKDFYMIQIPLDFPNFISDSNFYDYGLNYENVFNRNDLLVLIEQRKDILVGIIDKNNGYNIKYTDNNFNDIIFLLDSLSLLYEITDEFIVCNYTMYDEECCIDFKPFILHEFTIELIDDGTYVGIKIDVNPPYLFLDSFILTHNSNELIRLVKRHKYANKKCLIIKYANDIRYSDKVTTHDGIQMPSLNVIELNVIDLNEVKDIDDYDIIGIDEGQFIKNLNLVKEWADKGKIIYIAGLDSDFKTESFPSIVDLISKSENIIKLKAVCECGNDASFTHRIDKKNLRTELIGGKESYKSLCRNCYRLENSTNFIS